MRTPKASGLIELRNGRSNDRPSLSQQFQIQRNRHSCTTRKMAVSKSFGSRPKLSGTSKSTLISLRAVRLPHTIGVRKSVQFRPALVRLQRTDSSREPPRSAQRCRAIRERVGVAPPTKKSAGGHEQHTLSGGVQLRGKNWLCRSRKRRQTKPLVFLLPYFGTRRSKVQILSPPLESVLYKGNSGFCGC